MNSSNPLQTEESGIANDIYYAASAVSPNANHQVQRVPLFSIEHSVKPVPNAAQTMEDQQFEDPECLACSQSDPVYISSRVDVGNFAFPVKIS